MDNTINPQFVNDIAPRPERPQFLKVLCILTWIMCGLTFIKTVSTLVMPTNIEQQQDQIDKMRDLNPEAADKMEGVLNSTSTADKTITNVISLVGLLLSAYGALLMWQLKKTGFYIYIVGELLPYLGFMFGGAEALNAAGAMAGAMGGAIIGVVIGLMVIADIAFFIMYGVNVKYMKK